MIDLAIVIPAYKPNFLERALRSVAQQGDQRFHVYVGDDEGPKEVFETAENFKSDRLTYCRFTKNLGRRSLVQHWARCISLTKEPWIWLFADDDEMDAGCVEAFYRTLSETKGRYPLYRFNFNWIDANSTVTHSFPPLPVEQDVYSFMAERLAELQPSCAQALIFSRSAYESRGGFPEFPMAWMSDDAFILSMARDVPIRTINGPRVRWRRSDLNISRVQTNSDLRRTKLKAVMQFIGWLGQTFANSNGMKVNRDIRQLSKSWFELRLDNDGSDILPFALIAQLSFFAWRTFGENPFTFFVRLARHNCRLIARHLRNRMRTQA